jgi:flagellar biosynthesis GTPase FlhF
MKKTTSIVILVFAMIFLCQCHHGYVAIGSEPGYDSYPYEGNEEERKYYEEQEREARKHYEEQEREARKFYEEQEREARKHREEQEREARKHYEEQEREAQKERYEKHKRYEYRYYPSTRVYYDVNRKVYFYLKGDKWRVSGNLPSGIRLRFQNYVTIQMDNDRPYMEHFEHKRKYGKHK